MELRGLELAAAVQGRPQRVVGLEKKDGIAELPGQADELLPEVSRLSIEPPIETHVPQAPEGGEEPRPVVEPETQLPRGDVRGFLFGCAMPVDRAEARTESDADVEGLTERLRILGPLLKRGQGLLEERDRLSVGRARHCLLSRLAQVPRRALPHRGAHRMVGQPLHVFGQPVRIEALDRADDAGVQVLAPLLEQRAVGDFMGERVLEGVLGIRERAAPRTETPPPADARVPVAPRPPSARSRRGAARRVRPCR